MNLSLERRNFDLRGGESEKDDDTKREGSTMMTGVSTNLGFLKISLT